MTTYFGICEGFQNGIPKDTETGPAVQDAILKKLDSGLFACSCSPLALRLPLELQVPDDHLLQVILWVTQANAFRRLAAMLSISNG